MLYDPKWEQKRDADVFSVAGLIAWLETQDPTTEYDYCVPGTCLAAQYLMSKGFSESKDYVIFPGSLNRVIPGLKFITSGHGARGENRAWTFGAALARAREVQGM